MTATTTRAGDEREAFEAWWKTQGYGDDIMRQINWQAWQARAALATAPEQAGEPVGWKLVPMKHEGRAGLTDAMMRAFYEAWALNEQRGSFERLNAAYNAMLTAAPPPASTNRLTSVMIGRAWRESGALSDSPPDWALAFAQNIARELIAATEGK